MVTLEEQGQKIAEQLGHGVVYKGPWLPYGPGGEFYGHFFEDDAVTESSFVASTLEDAREALTRIRKGFGAELPVFPGNPAESGLEHWQVTAKEYADSMSTLEDRYNELLKIELKGEGYDPNSPVGREAAQSAFGQLKKETGLTGLTFTDMAGMGHKAKVRLALEQGKSIPPEVLADYPDLQKKSNPSKVRFDRASIDSAIVAAKRLQSEKDLYIFATYLGYTIDSRPPPGMQQYVIVHPDSSIETVKPLGSTSNPSPGGNPIPEELDLARTLAIIDSRPKGRIIESKLREEFGDAVIDALRQGRYVVSGSAGYDPPLLVSLKGRELIQGGNPMRTEAQRKSFHERIFGKGSTPPLERLGRGQIANDLIPMPPEQGPPLPQGLGIRWPWRR